MSELQRPTRTESKMCFAHVLHLQPEGDDDDDDDGDGDDDDDVEDDADADADGDGDGGAVDEIMMMRIMIRGS
jgi:hypothetical protein